VETCQLSKDNFLTSEAVFAVVQDRLPSQHKRVIDYSELVYSDQNNLQRALDQGELIVASYTNSWLSISDRLGDFFFSWVFGFFGSLLVFMMVGGVLGLVGSTNTFATIALFGLSVIAGFGLAMKYSRRLPPMAQRHLTLLNGKTRELIYACRVFDDEPTQELVRVPFGDLAVALSWGQIADHRPSFLSITLYQDLAIEGDRRQCWPSVCLAQVDHCYPAPPPADLVQKVETFAKILGARYAGLIKE
jgi:hypothetical protein